MEGGPGGPGWLAGSRFSIQCENCAARQIAGIRLER